MPRDAHLVPGLQYLAEGGQTTEVHFAHGFDVPEFALFPLLDDAAAVAVLQELYRRYLETAVRHGFGALVGGLDYRASPDWAGRLGWSLDRLADAQLRSIEFLREVSAPYRDQLADLRLAGLVGPRGDAYSHHGPVDPAAAEDYHSVQLSTLAEAGVDVVQAMAVGDIGEATGIARAAAAVDLPLILFVTVDRHGRLRSGATLRELVAAVDDTTGEDRPSGYGINCAHPSELRVAIDDGDWFRRVCALRPNAVAADKAALARSEHLQRGDPVELGRLMGELARDHPHLTVWGGCCGTWDEHLDHIADQVARHRPPRRQPPT